MQGTTAHLYHPEKARKAALRPFDRTIVATDGAQITMFHPPPDVATKSRTHILFIPPLGCSDLTPFSARLDEIAITRQSVLFALVFPTEVTERDRSLLQMICDAERLFRGGCDALTIVVCEIATFAYLLRSKGMRPGKDAVEFLQQ
jgi:hypothetical protein